MSLCFHNKINLTSAKSKIIAEHELIKQISLGLLVLILYSFIWTSVNMKSCETFEDALKLFLVLINS